jgi:hypothetical protein
MIVATVESWAEMFLDAWRYVGYKSYTHFAYDKFACFVCCYKSYLRAVGQEIETWYMDSMSNASQSQERLTGHKQDSIYA